MAEEKAFDNQTIEAIKEKSAYEVVIAATRKSNVDAIAFYKRLGFRVVKEPFRGLDPDLYCGLVYM